MKSVISESPVWTEPLKICSYDVDFTRRVTSASLCRHFLEAAWNHAEALGVGFSHLLTQSKYSLTKANGDEVCRARLEWGETRLASGRRSSAGDTLRG